MRSGPGGAGWKSGPCGSRVRVTRRGTPGQCGANAGPTDGGQAMGRKPGRRPAVSAARRLFELLERRTLLSITWADRADSDFGLVYGPAAPAAERVVDYALGLWNRVAPGADLNVSLYAYRPGVAFPQDQARNRLNQDLAAHPSALGETLVTQRHP